MKSQGSAPEAHKTLQSQNRPSAGNRLSVNALNVVHGRHDSPIWLFPRLLPLRPWPTDQGAAKISRFALSVASLLIRAQSSASARSCSSFSRRSFMLSTGAICGKRGRPLTERPYLADCNCSRFATMAAIRARNIPISLRSSWRSGPDGSLRADSSSLAAMFSRSCISSPIAFRCAEHNGLGGKLCLFGIGLSAQLGPGEGWPGL